MELYLNGQFGFIDDPDRQFCNGLVWTRTRTRSDCPEPSLTLAMMTQYGPKTYCTEVNAEDTEQWNEAIGMKVASMECHEIFTLVEKIPGGATMIDSHWVMGRRLMPDGTINKWKV